ncbi:hypothetical protein [Planomonospora sp. ID82291]|uniref:hypothetical protein n=1 Tax=Planomonospora sp. ID82291 TaxID=2738136 RepID=UPI0018C3CD89|nr:hypothetical protein [Planomonospora sp. ID82291]MBG0818710.1 hypothetical protein [Planomonospora sp. ID82291]
MTDPAQAVDEFGFVRWLTSKQGPVTRRDQMTKAALVATRPDGRPVMGVGDRMGAYAGGRKFGDVSIPSPRLSITIIDPDRFAAWALAEGFATEVETVQRVRPGFFNALKKVAETSGAARADLKLVHPRTGALIEVPGVQVSVAASTPTFTPAADAEQVLAEAHQRGALAALFGRVVAMPAVPAGDDDDSEDGER